MRKKLFTTLSFIVFLYINTVAQLTIPYTFENNSRYNDEDIYIGLVGKIDPIGDVFMNINDSSIVKMSSDLNTIDGPVWSHPVEWKYPDIFTKLSDITNNTIQIPQGLFACRIFISFESPMFLHFHEGENAGYAGANLNSDTDPNDGIRWELIELTWGDAGLWTNTSRVDAYQYPMGLEVSGFQGGITETTYEASYNNAINGTGTPKFKRVGELISHDEILALWNENVDEEYWVAKTVKTNSIDGEPIIEQPSKVEAFPRDILDNYIDDIWETYTDYDLNINIGDRGTWIGRIDEDGVFNFTDPVDGSIAKIYSKPTSINAIEGSGSLAMTPHDASINIEAFNEDLLIQAQMAAAISRHAIYTDIIDNTIQYTHDANRFFQIEPYNQYVSFFHDETISFESQTYAFAYDDVGDHSSTIQTTFPTNAKVIIGGYAPRETSESAINYLEIDAPSTNLSTNTSLKFNAQAYNQNNIPISTRVTWSVVNSNNASINNDGVFNTSVPGTYIIRASQNDIFVEETIIINLLEESSTETIGDINNKISFLSLYPNPSTEKYTYILGTTSSYNVSVFTITGQSIDCPFTFNIDTTQIDTSNLSSGLYLVEVTNTENDFSKTFKLVIN